jgi:hypothetical protein
MENVADPAVVAKWAATRARAGSAGDLLLYGDGVDPRLRTALDTRGLDTRGSAPRSGIEALVREARVEAGRQVMSLGSKEDGNVTVVARSQVFPILDSFRDAVSRPPRRRACGSGGMSRKEVRDMTPDEVWADGVKATVFFILTTLAFVLIGFFIR